MRSRLRTPGAPIRRQYSPRIVDAIRAHPERAILPHGVNNNTARHRGLPRDAELKPIEQTLAVMRQVFGKTPPAELYDRLDERRSAVLVHLDGGRLLNIPYSLETNDFTLVLTARRPGPELARAVIDHFDQL